MVSNYNCVPLEKMEQVSASVNEYNHDEDYASLLHSVQNTFRDFIDDGFELFSTDVVGLYDTYLDNLPLERQIHTCRTCRKFIQNFGGLVVVKDDGSVVPVMWNPVNVPEFYRKTVSAMNKAVHTARIIGPFFTNEMRLGIPTTGNWTHFSVDGAKVHKNSLLTPMQATTAKREDFRNVVSALQEFSPLMLDEALRLLQGDHLHRSEKFTGPIKWLRNLHDRPKGRAGENLLWRAVASSPNGYCHPRAAVTGSLLEDIAAGLSFDMIKRRFNAKVAPLAYQRPQAQPSAGNILAAEKIVEKLGIAPSLERRFARLDEVVTTWTPTTKFAPNVSGGVFDHIKPKNTKETIRKLDVPTVTMTWEKFVRTVLPTAETIELNVPRNGRFIALTTAVNPDAPPILKWDRPDDRNTVAWYVYPGGSAASNWGLSAGWTKVLGVIPLPTLWGDNPSPFLGEGVVLALEGAIDSNENSGNALFPEALKVDLHSVRATIEAYSRSASLGGRKGVLASGYDIRKTTANCHLRVISLGHQAEYMIDRWD